MCLKLHPLRTENFKLNPSLGSLCLGSICMGLTLGSPESLLSYLLLTHSDTTHYDFSSDGPSTVQMIMNFGSCLGALLPPCIADSYGRKSAFAIAGVTNFTFWIILVSFEGYLEIVLGAALGGFAAGIFVTTTALYVSEISLPHTRGASGALVAFFAYVGVLFGSCLVFVTFVRIIALIMACLAMMFLASLRWWMVESPYFLFLQGQTLETKLSLKALRGARTVIEIDQEYKTIELFFSTNADDPSNTERPKNKCSALSMSTKRGYAIFVVIFLCITEMVGAYGMADYSKTFFNRILPDSGRIVISSLDVCSVAICFYVIEKFSRKFVLLAISIVGSSMSCLVLAIFTFAKNGPKNHQEGQDSSILLPATILGLYYLVYSLGLTPILPILTGEIFPSRCKTVAVSCSISFVYLSSMIIQFIFEILNAKQGSNLAFVSFAIVGSFGIPFVFNFLPETQGKTLHEIQHELDEFTIFLY